MYDFNMIDSLYFVNGRYVQKKKKIPIIIWLAYKKKLMVKYSVQIIIPIEVWYLISFGNGVESDLLK